MKLSKVENRGSTFENTRERLEIPVPYPIRCSPPQYDSPGTPGTAPTCTSRWPGWQHHQEPHTGCVRQDFYHGMRDVAENAYRHGFAALWC